MLNSEYFHEVLGWFKTSELKKFAKVYVDLFPPYFETKPASSTGKYHAPWSNGIGGLRAHTHAVCYVTHALADAYMLKDIEHDAALVAALGHDAVKYGFSGDFRYTSKTHEAEGAIFFKRVVTSLGVDLPLFQDIYDAIAIHQGRWAVSATPKEFPTDFSSIAQLVHVADMVASRPEIRFNFLETSLIG